MQERDITLELREERRLQESCEHCRCENCPEFCCFCDKLKPDADPGDRLAAECDAAYDAWRDKGV